MSTTENYTMRYQTGWKEVKGNILMFRNNLILINITDDNREYEMLANFNTEEGNYAFIEKIATGLADFEKTFYLFAAEDTQMEEVLTTIEDRLTDEV